MIDYTKLVTKADKMATEKESARVKVVSMRQARLALLNAGLLTKVNNMIATMAGSQGDAARIEWEFSSEVERDRGLVTVLGAGLNLTPAQLDALFTSAAAIR